MKTFRAVAIIEKLSTAELDLLEEYLSLPSTGCRPQAKVLFVILRQHIKDIPDSKAAISNLTHTAPDRLDDLMSKLLLHIEAFCARQSLLKETSEMTLDRHLLAFYSEKGLTDLYGTCKQKIERKLKNSKANFPVEHLDLYNYNTDLAVHDKIHKGRKLSVELLAYAPHLDVFYCSEKLKVICECMNRKNISNTPCSNDNKAIFQLAGKYARQYPVIETYLAIADFLKTQKITLEKFDKLYNYVTGIPVLLPTYTEILSLCHYLINMCLRGIKNGIKDFQKRFIDLIVFMELQGLLLERETISAPIFSAVIRIGLKEKGVTWTESFLKKYGAHLPPESKAEIIAFSEARILFAQKKYSASEKKLDLIDTAVVDVYFKMNIHKLRIKMLVEENIDKARFDISMVDKKLRNFGLFLTSNKKIGDPNRQELLKFNLYVKRIAANYGLKDRRNAVYTKLMNEKQIAEKDWLLSLFNKKA